MQILQGFYEDLQGFYKSIWNPSLDQWDYGICYN